MLLSGSPSTRECLKVRKKNKTKVSSIVMAWNQEKRETKIFHGMVKFKIQANSSFKTINYAHMKPLFNVLTSNHCKVYYTALIKTFGLNVKNTKTSYISFRMITENVSLMKAA